MSPTWKLSFSEGITKILSDIEDSGGKIFDTQSARLTQVESSLAKFTETRLDAYYFCLMTSSTFLGQVLEVVIVRDFATAAW